MARVALRTLTREIEDQIEHGQIDQAIANCRHILTFFPKHVDTYRLLGKAYMEVQRYGDASDVFQRVLSSVPEDFIAHLGMSIIQEDEGNLDEAIWHMERAFEMQPANAAVQGELRRLYGRRDGFEPPKVRLTRGALARMYVKGGLFPQAIAELRSALAEESQRPDLLTLLAKAYYLFGQKVEAADTCNSLLSRLPYSLEGNRLLAEILNGSERANEAETYRQRVQALDPYSAHISPAASSAEVVPDGAVTLERLDWRPGQLEGESPSQPEWAASLGVNVDELTPEKESLPDWLSNAPTGDQASPNSTEGEPGEFSNIQQAWEAPEPPDQLNPTSSWSGPSEENVPGSGDLGLPGLAASGENDEEIPAWMREAGWGASQGEAEESGPPHAEGEQAQDEELVPAELPDWLRSMAPTEGFETDTEEADAPKSALLEEEGKPQEGIIPDKQPTADFIPWLSENPPGATDSVVTWLENKETEPVEPETPAFGQEGDMSAVDIPEWLRDIEESGAESDALSPETSANPPDFPEWLESRQEDVSAEEAPDWLKEMVENPEKGANLPQEESPMAEEDALPGELYEWQSEAAAESPIASGEEPIIQASEPEVELPTDWSFEIEPVSEETVGPAESEPIPGELLGTTEEDDAAFAWLESLAARQGGEEGLISSPDERQETQPEWMQGPAEDQESQPSTGEADLPVEIFDLESQEVAGEEKVEMPDWLQAGPDQSEPAPVEELEAAGEEAPQAAAELPDWLRGLATGAGEGEAALGWEEKEEAGVQPVEAAELPDWLNETAEPPAVEAEAPAGLASLEEPPVSEGDTKPTRVAKASEVSIPSALAGFVASAKAFLHRKKEAESPEEAPVEAGLEGKGPLEIPIEPQTGEEIQPEMQREELQVEGASSVEKLAIEAISQEEEQPAEEIRAEEPEMVEPAEEVQPAAETPVALIGAAVYHTAEPEEEALGRTAEAEPGLEEKEETAGQQPEAAGLPDWLRDMEEEPDTRWEPQAWDTEETGEPKAEQPVGEGEMFEQEEAFAWLEGLAARQGADEGLRVSPEERQELPPDWVAAEAASATTAEEPVLHESEPETEATAWSVEVFEQPETKLEAGPQFGSSIEEVDEAGSIEEAVNLESLPFEDEVDIPAESTLDVEVFVGEEAVSDMTAETEGIFAEEAATEFPAPLEPGFTEEAEQGEASTEEIPELPAWLAGYEQAPGEEDLSWTPPEAEPGQYQQPSDAEQPIETEEHIPMPERLDLNQAALIELERVPGIGFVRAQALLAYRETHGPLASIEDLKDVPGFEAETLAQIQDRVMVAVPLSPEEMPVDAHQLALIQARNALAEGDRDKALDHYTSIIKGRAMLPDVIQDLHEALYRFPVDVSIWQALGDAYARNDQLQQAIDTYTKAEELLR